MKRRDTVSMSLLVGWLGLGASGLACGGSDVVGGDGEGGEGTTTDDGADTSESGQNQSGADEDAGGDEVPAACGEIDLEDPCEACVAEACTSEGLECCSTEGCMDVLSCAREVGCDGVSCYQPDTCQAEIDAAGGPTSPAIPAAQALGNCAYENCAVCFEGYGGGGGS
jgi:hypothetical protein